MYINIDRELKTKNKNMEVYLDNAATTKLDDNVLKIMINYFKNDYGNASSIHFKGDISYNVQEKSRKEISEILNCEPKNIVFTSSATESNNMIIKGVARANKSKGNHILVSAIEHPCVLNSAEQLKKEGFEVEHIPVALDGVIDLNILEKMIRPDTVLVSIMAVNNEIGVIQDIKAIAKIVHDKGSFYHVDAVQSVPYLNIDIKDWNVDFLSLSAHKFYGPKGVGLVYINKNIKIEPLIVGGGQEFGFRSSTYNTPGIVGMAEAIKIAYGIERESNLKKIKELRDYLLNRIQNEIPDIFINGSLDKRTPNNLNVGFKGVEGEAILMDLSSKGICVSTGSACGSANLKASHVLNGIGVSGYFIHSNIRFSLGKYNTMEEIDYTVDCLKDTIVRLRKFSAIKN